MNFSVLNRKNQLEEIANTTFDMLIIGGGITGAGIVLDAASRGLKVCLIEKNDFASGTSSKSTKLIHGGLRYLKQLDFSLVKESGTERAIVHHLAPHLVIPEKMLLPLIKNGNYGRLMTSMGLKIYDFLANVKPQDKRVMLNKKQTLDREPLLNKKKILGSGYYAEYRTDDARLTLENLKTATSYGALILNYCEMQSFNYDVNSKIESVNCFDKDSQKKLVVKAKQIVSAAGPWVENLINKEPSKKKQYLYLTKGVHLVFPHPKIPIKQAIYFDAPDKRMVFAIPRGRVTYVGTTDTPYSGDLNRVVATKEDASYLLKAIKNAFPNISLSINDIESSWAGLRPLIYKKGKSPSELSRKDDIFISKSGLISIAGGKLTGYRKMAHRVMDAVLKNSDLGDKAFYKKSITETISLVKPAFPSYAAVKDYQKDIEKQLASLGILDSYYAWYLTTNYGMQTNLIIDKFKSFQDSDSLTKLIRAELWYGIHHEMVTNLSDFFVRRTGRLYFDIKSVEMYKDIVLKDCSNYLKWSRSREEHEIESLNRLISDATTCYDKEFPNQL